LKIKLDKEQVLKYFLNPVSRVSDECSINVTPENVFTVVNDLNGSTILFCKLKTDTNIGDGNTVKLNVKDIKKLIRVFDCINLDEFEIEVDSNASQLKYKSADISFKMHLVTDSVIKKVSTDVNKIQKLQFNTELILSRDRLAEILKGSVFATDSNKIYFFTKDGQVYAELTDKATEDLDSITFSVTDSFTGDELTEPLPFSLELLRTLSGLKTDDIKVKINNTYKIIMFEIATEKSTLKYIISAYTK